MDKVLVIKQQGRISAQYPVGAGGPVLVLGGGGDQRGARGQTRRERLGGAAGKFLGALGALTGKQRSLGGLVQSAISGAAQGGAIGAGLGRATVGRKRQAQADYDEATRQKYTEEDVRGNLGMFSGTKPKSPEEMRNQMKYLARQRAEEQAEAKARAREERQRSDAYARQLGTEVGVEDRSALERMRIQADRLGVPVHQLMGKVGVLMPHLQRLDEEKRQRQINEALEDPMFSFLNNDQSSEVAVVGSNQDATSNPIQPIGPNNPVPMPLPPGTVGSGDESADPVGTNITNQTGFNMTTENEPSDNMPPQSQLTSMNEEDEEDEEEEGRRMGETRLLKPNQVRVQGQ